jgi:hypothetical protein
MKPNDANWEMRMSASDEAKLKRFLGGLSAPEDMQEPPGPDGDPQLVALTQFLQTLSDTLGPDDVILDVGSGRGILAHALLGIWPVDDSRPWYFAVDRAEALDTLSLPRSVHNHSQKVLFTDFLAGSMPGAPQRVKVVVLRNILHELDIPTTAAVLTAVGKITQSAGRVYLQDIVSLPKGERGNAGWPTDLLRQVLEGLGFACGSPTEQRSRSGTPWFTFILKRASESLVSSPRDAARLIAAAREEQRRRRTARLAELSDSNEETVAEYVMLNAEVAALGAQLQQNLYAGTHPMAGARVLAGIPLIALPPSVLDYAEELPSSPNTRSGLRAILSSKNLIDLPALLRSAFARLWFAGYSERLLFAIPELRAALHDAALRGVDIRILLVDPKSPAARARSASEAYVEPSDLFVDIKNTRQAFAEFDADLREHSPDSSTVRCELRLCRAILSSSFFFVDDLCICSLYTSNLTGGAGAAFVFGSSSVQPNGYFQVLLREFQSGWSEPPLRVDDRPLFARSGGESAPT